MPERGTVFIIGQLEQIQEAAQDDCSRSSTAKRGAATCSSSRPRRAARAGVAPRRPPRPLRARQPDRVRLPPLRAKPRDVPESTSGTCCTICCAFRPAARRAAHGKHARSRRAGAASSSIPTARATTILGGAFVSSCGASAKGAREPKLEEPWCARLVQKQWPATSPSCATRSRAPSTAARRLPLRRCARWRLRVEAADQSSRARPSSPEPASAPVRDAEIPFRRT